MYASVSGGARQTHQGDEQQDQDQDSDHAEKSHCSSLPSVSLEYAQHNVIETRVSQVSLLGKRYELRKWTSV